MSDRQFYKVLLILLALLGAVCLMGCSSHEPAPSIWHPVQAANQILHHTQAAVEHVNTFAFVVSLIGLGLLVYGAATADHPLEHIGILIASIAGTVTVGTLVGLFILPFAPMAILLAFVAGIGYVVYMLYEEHVIKPPTAIVPVPTISLVAGLPKVDWKTSAVISASPTMIDAHNQASVPTPNNPNSPPAKPLGAA